MMMGRHRSMIARESDRARNPRRTLRQTLAYLRPHKIALAIAGLLVTLNALFRILGPYLVGIAVDRYIERADVAGLNRTALLLFAVYLGGWLSRAAQMFITVTIGQKVLYKMREDIFLKLQRLSLRFFDRNETGDLMSRLTNDTDAINRTLNNGLAQFIGNIIFLLGVLVSMLLLNWRLALVSLSVLPMMFLSTLFFTRRARQAARKARRELGRVSTELESTISGVRVVQAFGREDKSIDRFRQVNAANRDANVETQTVTAAFAPALDVFGTIGIALVLGAGGYLYNRNLVTIGVIFAFLNYVRRFFQPVRAIGILSTQVQIAIAAAERIFDLLQEPIEITDTPDAISLEHAEGWIRFEDVHFAYEPNKPVLKGVSFEIEPGQTLAIVGPTGAGKTTIVNLLMRFYDVDQGRILLDEHDIRHIRLDDLRRQFGMVLQDTFLFSTTVMENIRYGRLEASDEEVIAAAKQAGADDFIRRLPQGYETKLGERGASLSQGQRQLIAIARAILADPRILILDEATSNVDTRTERLIQQALDHLMADRTSVVIAHRLSTIRNADQVIVLRDGQIIEHGTHRSLLEAKGFYYRLYMSQFDEMAEGE